MRSLPLRCNQSQWVNIVVTCTKRKRVPPAADLWLRDIQAPDLPTTFAIWLDRLRASKAEAIPARRLYAGDHWSVVQTLEDVAVASGFDAAVWVCSAGYGLIEIDAKIKPYSATLSANHPDTVCKRHELDSIRGESKSWWRLQTQWSGPDASRPRSIAKVAEMYPECPLLVVASKVYLRAIIEDVRKAAENLLDSDLLFLISTGTDFLPGLDANLLPSSAALQRSVGGSLRSLNIRLARAILTDFTAKDLCASGLVADFKQRVAAALPLPKYQRETMTDVEVREYIGEALTKDSKANWGTLLRTLRNSGRACSQERISRLFQATKASLANN